MKTMLEWLDLNGEICVECLLVTTFMGVMAYSIMTIV